ncbi:hypothetical protein CYMTET_25354 [Cymbomonas tetramitiformis]|uniref:Uncharacterized protein n=1 Tax=Cymbomonas tetramitiformis TaxID=36881 RepID=A0AAE0KYZ9_9CHLO|nr:hypothetical protein CYMTET_25354 [Cymbomonas tetramitiformis]
MAIPRLRGEVRALGEAGQWHAPHRSQVASAYSSQHAAPSSGEVWFTQVLFMSGGAMTRARWMMERFRDVATCLGLHYSGGDAPSTGLLGLYLSLQICGKVSVYGLGAARTSWERAVNTSATSSDLAADLASRQASGWGDILDGALPTKGLSQGAQGGSRNSANEEPERVFDGGTSMARTAWTQNPACRAYGIRPTAATWRLPIKQSPYPYHYFLKWPDSARLYPHGHHDFDSESDFMFLMHLGSPRLAFCPPADACEGSMTSACRNVVLPSLTVHGA